MQLPPTPEQIKECIEIYLAKHNFFSPPDDLEHPRLILFCIEPGTFPNSLILTFGIQPSEDVDQLSPEIQNAVNLCLENLFATYTRARAYDLNIEYAN